MAISEAQKRAVKKYETKLKRISLCIPKEHYPIIQAAAKEANESMNEYIKKAILIRLTLDD